MREPAVAPPPHPATESEPLGPAQVSLWSGFSALMRWSLAATGAMLPLIVVVQALLATGIVIGFGFVIPDITPDTALFLASGAPTILLLTIGLVIVPQGVSRARASGALDYQRALPVSRPLLLLVDLVVWTLIALPGVAIGLVVAWLRYDIAFSFDWPLLILASVLVTTMATALGYAIAVTFPAMLAQLLSQVLRHRRASTLVLGIEIMTECLAGLQRDGDMCGLPLLQHVQQHAGEAIHRVGLLSTGGA